MGAEPSQNTPRPTQRSLSVTMKHTTPEAGCIPRQPSCCPQATRTPAHRTRAHPCACGCARARAARHEGGRMGMHALPLPALRPGGEDAQSEVGRCLPSHAMNNTASGLVRTASLAPCFEHAPASRRLGVLCPWARRASPPAARNFAAAPPFGCFRNAPRASATTLDLFARATEPTRGVIDLSRHRVRRFRPASWRR